MLMKFPKPRTDKGTYVWHLNCSGRGVRVMRHEKPRLGAFTLVELMVVLGILGLLAAILLPAFSFGKVRAQLTKDASTMRQISQAVLLYHSSEGYLPGRVNRAVRVPGSVPDAKRHRWFSTFMADAGFLPDDDEFWSPVVDYGIEEAGHGYILNNTIYSSPGNFFGRRSNNPDKVSPPLKILDLKSNLEAEDPDDEPVSKIWMITNLDGSNYNVSATAGSEYAVDGTVRTPWGGRNYAFFDGRVEFLEEGTYPSRR